MSSLTRCRADLVDAGLYVSGKYESCNAAYIHSIGVSLVINVSGEDASDDTKAGYAQHDIEYVHLHMRDICNQDLMPTCEKAAVYVEAAYGCVLIHCAMGISRSVSVAAYVMMQRHNQSYEDIIASISRKRPGVDPNNGFVKQLKAFHVCKLNKDKRYRLNLLEWTKYFFDSISSMFTSPSDVSASPYESCFDSLLDAPRHMSTT